MRGYAAIGLDNPKSAPNVGSILRACAVYDVSLLAISGPRFKRMKSNPTDTLKAWRHFPVLEVADVFDALPYDCVPIAVEFDPNASPLPTFKHPQRAFYIFGAEDATLGKRITDRCKQTVVVPTKYCMNLAATVNVLLYDRLAKELSDG
jgi:tRNA(Leu) C34 or U34 (ribose-2'-O)-methylase TrmL